jgi:potassium efflux system protein
MNRRTWLLLAIACAAMAAWGGEEPPAPPKAPQLTREVIEQRVKALAEATGVADDVRAAAQKLYAETLTAIDEAGRAATAAGAFQAKRAAAPEETAAQQARREELKQAPSYEPPVGLKLEDAEDELAKATAELKAASKALLDINEEAARRQERRRKLPAEIGAAEDRLTEARQQASAAPPTEAPELVAARACLVQARVQLAEAQLAMAQNELACYEARDRLLPIRQEVHAAEEKAAKSRATALQELVQRLRREEAEKYLRDATRDVRDSADDYAFVQDIAAANLEFTKKRLGPDGIVTKLEAAAERLRRAEEQLKQIRNDHQRSQERMEAGGLAEGLGRLLRSLRASLPSTRRLRIDLRSLRRTVADVELDLIDLRERLAEVSDLDAEMTRVLGEVEPTPEGDERVRVEARLRELLTRQVEILKPLKEETRRYFDTLVDTEARETEIVAETEAFRDFIGEHVLWIRSTDPIWKARPSDVVAAGRWLLDPQHWVDVIKGAGTEVGEMAGLYVLALLAVALLGMSRRNLIRRLDELADLAARPGELSHMVSVQALFYTVVIALPGPALVWFLGLRLGSFTQGGDLVRALDIALDMTARAYLPFEIFRQMARPRGLGEAHFRWPATLVPHVRRSVTQWLLIVLPLLALLTVLLYQPDETYKASLGRVLFLVVCLLTTWVHWRPLREAGMLGGVAVQDEPGLIAFGRWLFGRMMLLMPLLLAVLAMFGYVYTSVVLYHRLLGTFILVFGLVVAHGMLIRWMLVAHVRLALEQRRKRRVAEERAAAKEGEDGTSPPQPGREEPEALGMSYGELRSKTRTLINWGLGIAGVIGLYAIWSEVLPALGVFHRYSLWGTAEATGGLGLVTVGDLLIALVIAALISIAVRNLPGVLEVVLLRRLNMDAGARFAVNAIARYTIATIGVIAVASRLGFQWSSVQWLLAGLTVGLGFGLQEIVANFVSGLILLFERPVRVGDTVTIGDVTGTVSRIRIRATTITEWDRKELIVPNKEFITGHLINWTLSDELVRIEIPVGIVYGSDTAKAREILLRVARGVEGVLADPEPRAWFLGFGDSSLDFELRVYVTGVELFIAVRDALHFGIDQEFRKAGIVIAFPQRDLHVFAGDRSIPVDVSKPGNATEEG